MKTLEFIIHVTPDRQAVVRLPGDVTPGEHRAVLVIEGPSSSAARRAPLKLRTHDIELLNPKETFRREDMYGDSGR